MTLSNLGPNKLGLFTKNVDNTEYNLLEYADLHVLVRPTDCTKPWGQRQGVNAGVDFAVHMSSKPREHCLLVPQSPVTAFEAQSSSSPPFGVLVFRAGQQKAIFSYSVLLVRVRSTRYYLLHNPTRLSIYGLSEGSSRSLKHMHCTE